MTARTQFTGPSRSDICDVVIGFDFGTSCSKVIVRTPLHQGGRAFAIPFESGHETCKYLLPSVLWLDGDRTSLKQTANSDLLRDIKLHLMKPDGVPAINNSETNAKSLDPKPVTVAFLALAVREVRKWFLESQQAAYGNLRLRWALHIGLPSADFRDEALRATYEEIANAAWCLSVTETEIGISTASDVLADPESWNSLPDPASAEIAAIPEVAAEVAGYAVSKRREKEPGLFMLIDVGASTLDICSFILQEADGDDSYELLTTDVKMLGATILYQQRVEAVRAAVDRHMDDLWNKYDPVSAMPDRGRDYAPSHDEISDSIARHDSEYQARCRQTVWKTIMALVQDRDPNSSRWESSLPVFLAGGGSAMQFYRDFIVDNSARLIEFGKNHRGCTGIEQLAFEIQDNLEGDLNQEHYHRFAVAWGLSFDKFDIGNVTSPDEIDDIEGKEDINPYEGFISKDMV